MKKHLFPGDIVRGYDNLHAAHADGFADPTLHGIGRGLKQEFAVGDDVDLPDELSNLVARLRSCDSDDDLEEDDCSRACQTSSARERV